MVKVQHTVYYKMNMYFGGEIGFTDTGSFCLRLFTNPGLDDEHRGTFTTFFPISKMEYREQHPTKARARLNEDYSLDVYDDWGFPQQIIVEDRATIDKIVHECREQKLEVEVCV